MKGSGLSKRIVAILAAVAVISACPAGEKNVEAAAPVDQVLETEAEIAPVPLAEEQRSTAPAPVAAEVTPAVDLASIDVDPIQLPAEDEAHADQIPADTPAEAEKKAEDQDKARKDKEKEAESVLDQINARVYRDFSYTEAVDESVKITAKGKFPKDLVLYAVPAVRAEEEIKSDGQSVKTVLAAYDFSFYQKDEAGNVDTANPVEPEGEVRILLENLAEMGSKEYKIFYKAMNGDYIEKETVTAGKKVEIKYDKTGAYVLLVAEADSGSMDNPEITVCISGMEAEMNVVFAVLHIGEEKSEECKLTADQYGGEEIPWCGDYDYLGAYYSEGEVDQLQDALPISRIYRDLNTNQWMLETRDGSKKEVAAKPYLYFDYIRKNEVEKTDEIR